MRREKSIWRVSLCVAAVSLAALTYELCWDKGLVGALLVLPASMVFSVVLVGLALLAGRAEAGRSIPLLLVFAALAFSVYHWRAAGNYVRFETRWILHRKGLRQEVLSNAGAARSLRHLQWDDWGMAGTGTESYLVFDPTDRLRGATHAGSGRHSAALPCDVWQIWRLEPQWYSVVFYTDQIWPDPVEESASRAAC